MPWLSSTIPRRLPFLFALIASDASGQHNLLHSCRPQARRAMHGLSQRISFSSTPETEAEWTWKQAILFVVAPHRQGRTIWTVHGGQDPVWHFAVHWCEHARCGLEQTESQVGMGSEQSRRAGNLYCDASEDGVGAMVFLPHGHLSIFDGDRGHIADLDEGGWHDFSH